MTHPKTLRMRDIERFENTTVVAAAFAGDIFAVDLRTIHIPQTMCCNTGCPTYICRITL